RAVDWPRKRQAHGPRRCQSQQWKVRLEEASEPVWPGLRREIEEHRAAVCLDADRKRRRQFLTPFRRAIGGPWRGRIGPRVGLKYGEVAGLLGRGREPLEMRGHQHAIEQHETFNGEA